MKAARQRMAELTVPMIAFVFGDNQVLAEAVIEAQEQAMG